MTSSQNPYTMVCVCVFDQEMASQHIVPAYQSAEIKAHVYTFPQTVVQCVINVLIQFLHISIFQMKPSLLWKRFFLI